MIDNRNLAHLALPTVAATKKHTKGQPTLPPGQQAIADAIPMRATTTMAAAFSAAQKKDQRK